MDINFKDMKAFVLDALGLLKDWKRECRVALEYMVERLSGRNLLNQKQCEDLTTKLTKINENMHWLMEGKYREIGWDDCQHACQNIYRCLEKARMLVENCGEREWWCAAAFQWHNENAFREILLDANLCYNHIYERAEKCLKTGLPVDLRQTSVFERASDDDVQEDENFLFLRLTQFVKGPIGLQTYLPCLEKQPYDQKVELAKYLLLKMNFAREEPHAIPVEKIKQILWEEHNKLHPCFPERSSSTSVRTFSTEWLGKPCFQKVFPEDEGEYETLVLKEMAIMAHLKHPNIIRFFCCGNGKASGSRFIGMERMEKSLSDLIKDLKRKSDCLSLDACIDIFDQIARAMCYLHDQGIAHLDLKPHNVVVNEMKSSHLKGYYEVKLIDYGTSKLEIEAAKSNTITSFGIGTTIYRAPELFPNAKKMSRGRTWWYKADAYSFAMTCVYILTLHEPFEGMFIKIDDLYNEIINGTRPSFPKDCPEPLQALLVECWSNNPYKRPTFGDISSRLKRLRFNGPYLESNITTSTPDFVFNKIEAQSTYYKNAPKLVFEKSNDEDSSNLASIISCTCNHNLTHVQKPPYEGGFAQCNMCGEGDIDGEVYHCSTCQFDAHSDCAEIREKVQVSFHGHLLQLLTQNFYKNDPEAMCSLCEESIQFSEWVYRCERCEYDVHALCTKFPGTRRWQTHVHPLTMRSCPPHKSLSCRRCSGEIHGRTWHYYCRLCAFSMHLSCVIRPTNPLCLFDNSHHHRLVLGKVPRIFDCALCEEQGYSQFYHCKHCSVDMHPHCVDYMSEETCNWNGVYEEVSMEKESKDVQAQTILISKILDMMASYCDYGATTSTQKPLSVVRKVHPRICKPTTPNQSHESVNLDNDVELQRKMISAQTAERIKAKKLASNRLRENPLEMLENLEKIVSNLQSFESASEDEKKDLIAVHERLKEHQQLVKEEKAIQEESKLCLGPRIGVFFKNVKKDGTLVRQLLIDLQGDMKDVCFGLLCEKRGHEHIVPRKTRMYNEKLGEKLAEILKPLLACGLQIVRNNITSTEDDLAELESISTPDLESDYLWDLSAINKIKGMEDVEVLKQAAVSSSEWFLKSSEIRANFKETFGLHRIRYIVTHEGNPPCYKNGSLAWLCQEHFNYGLKERILESYSSKYHGIEDDYEIRYPRYLRQE